MEQCRDGPDADLIAMERDSIERTLRPTYPGSPRGSQYSAMIREPRVIPTAQGPPTHLVSPPPTSSSVADQGRPRDDRASRPNPQEEGYPWPRRRPKGGGPLLCVQCGAVVCSCPDSPEYNVYNPEYARQVFDAEEAMTDFDHDPDSTGAGGSVSSHHQVLQVIDPDEELARSILHEEAAAAADTAVDIDEEIALGETWPDSDMPPMQPNTPGQTTTVITPDPDLELAGKLQQEEYEQERRDIAQARASLAEDTRRLEDNRRAPAEDNRKGRRGIAGSSQQTYPCSTSVSNQSSSQDGPPVGAQIGTYTEGQAEDADRPVQPMMTSEIEWMTDSRSPRNQE